MAPGGSGFIYKGKDSLEDSLSLNRSCPFPFSHPCLRHSMPWLGSFFKPGKLEEGRRRQREEGFQVY